MINNAMKWGTLLTNKRLGLEHYHEQRADDRTEFQRDYDRLIFSAPFRRLQNKTQVFPLPGSVFVHNRLTHSLEVASVGRSLGSMVSKLLKEKHSDCPPFMDEIGAIIAAACLAHDLGNPPFGHSGEQAIGTFFSEGYGHVVKDHLENPSYWSDFSHFEGNANAFRLLTHRFNGRREGGFAMTYATLATLIKYPYLSNHADINKAKFGFFHADEAIYLSIAKELGILHHPQHPQRFVRYPLTYLLEAADDICYQLMDMEDAQKLKIISADETKRLLQLFFQPTRLTRISETLLMVSDVNEQIAYLRSSVIGVLVDAVAQVFVTHEEAILSGTFQGSMIDKLPDPLFSAYRECANMAKNKIYCASEVLDVELAGHKIITTLLQELTQAVLFPQKAYSRQLLLRIPTQYELNSATLYEKMLAILDFISGMTDVYALDLYRKITGMSLPTL
jgi:dGTPase